MLKKTVTSVAVIAVLVGTSSYLYTSSKQSIGIKKELSGTNTSDTVTTSDTITACSFNIQFLGSSKSRENSALADLVSGYDVVVVQELVAPPNDGTYPDATSYTADIEAQAFAVEMTKRGFQYVLSGEDTGTGEKNHSNGTNTEWWIAFYKPSKLTTSDVIPCGFLANDRSNHDDYERVPYAFAFKTINGTMDFILISVHLQPGNGTKDKLRRKHELASIASWIDANDSLEKDFIILGDMNIYSAEELSDVTPKGYLSLNNECRVTNTNQPPDTKGRPYDHVMYNITFTTNEIDTVYDMEVINLIEAMKPTWTSKDPYPGDPYNHNEFRKHYSDHHPVVFRLISGYDDDNKSSIDTKKAYCDKNCVAEKRIGAKCKDGSPDTRTGKGACSGHGGVECWECDDE